MDATILPGPGTKTRPQSPRGGRPAQYSIGRPCLIPAGNDCRGRGRSHADRTRQPHQSQYFHLPSFAGDAYPARLCRQSARTPALRARPPHNLSRARVPAGRFAATRAALSGSDQPGDRRNRAPRGPARGQRRDVGRARSASRRPRRHGSNWQSSKRRTPRRSAKRSLPGCRKTKSAASCPAA